MSGVERRRLCCAVLFHCVAALCVMWSLFVLIDRAAEEIQRGLIAWPFWTKLVVVAVGFTGGAVFMYIQCRQYFTLCSRWRCHNRILLIQNAPEKIHAAPPSPIIHHLSLTTSNARGRRDPGDVERANHGQVVANIENNPGNSHAGCGRPPPPAEPGAHSHAHAYVEEEDDSGGFNDYRPNSFRRILTSENRNYSIVPLDRESKSRERVEEPVDIRRYSDTRLLQTFDSRHVLGLKVMDGVPQMYQTSPADKRLSASQPYPRSVEMANHSEECLDEAVAGYSPYDSAVYHISDKLDAGVGVGACAGLAPYGLDAQLQLQVSDIVFSPSAHYDPLELNIQEMLELDVKAQQRKRSVLSLTREQPAPCHKVNAYEANKSVFKSLPNLSASSESLLPQKPGS